MYNTEFGNVKYDSQEGVFLEDFKKMPKKRVNEYKQTLKNKFYDILENKKSEIQNRKATNVEMIKNEDVEEYDKLDQKTKPYFIEINEKISCYSGARSDFALGEDDSFRGYKKGYYTQGKYYQNWLQEDFHIYEMEGGSLTKKQREKLLEELTISNYVYNHFEKNEGFEYFTFRKGNFSYIESLANMNDIQKQIEINNENNDFSRKRAITREGFNDTSKYYKEKGISEYMLGLKTAQNLRKIGRKIGNLGLARIMGNQVLPSKKIRELEFEKSKNLEPFYYSLLEEYHKDSIKFNENIKKVLNWIDEEEIEYLNIYVIAKLIEKKYQNKETINIKFMNKQFGEYEANKMIQFLKANEF